MALAKTYGSKVEVEGVALHGIIDEIETDYIDILKIDIEGAEKEVFSDEKNSRKVLEKVRFIAVELHDEIDFKIKFEKILESHFIFYYSGQTLFGFNKFLLA